MSQQDAFNRILASLHEAAFDDAQWPVTSALIDEACGMRGSALVVGKGQSQRVFVNVSCHPFWPVPEA